MQEQIAWVAFIHTLLFIAALGYAKFLNQKHIYEWYNPDRVWMTVVGGDALIGLALGGMVLIGVIPAIVLVLYFSLHIAAGIPIIAWQRGRAARRREKVETIEKRP